MDVLVFPDKSVRILEESSSQRHDGFPGTGRMAGFMLTVMVAWAMTVNTSEGAESFGQLFGYSELPQSDINVFPQWLDILEERITERLEDGDCGELEFNRCHLAAWRAFLTEIGHLPKAEQLARVNDYANEQHYVLDIENYGLTDYWAIPQLFLENGGDCEDYVIVKLFSLRWLGWDVNDLRLVVVQDTNLRIPHAVLAVDDGTEVWILDNQVSSIVPQGAILHYAPVYSISDRQWWLHIPRG